MTKLSWQDPGKAPWAARFGMPERDAGSANGTAFTRGACSVLSWAPLGLSHAGGWEALTSVRSVSLVWKTVDQNQALRDT